jgi:hypothetical protein
MQGIIPDRRNRAKETHHANNLPAARIEVILYFALYIKPGSGVIAALSDTVTLGT